MMKEQGNQFDWSQIALDLLSLPCFDQEKIAKWEKAITGVEPSEELQFDDLLSDGYISLTPSGWSSVKVVVKVTGENPSITASNESLTITDCEPVELGLMYPNGVFKQRVLPVRYVTEDLYPIECVLTDEIKGDPIEDRTGFFCAIGSDDNGVAYSWLCIPDRNPSPGGGGGGNDPLG